MFISPDQELKNRSATVWERIAAQTDIDDALQSRAAVELERRLHHWHGDYLPRPSRFKNKHGIDRATHLVVQADPVELVIIRAVAMTKGAAQFGVSPDGTIFTAEGDGWTIQGPRVDVTRLSWLLDETADILQNLRHGKGGRFYERNGRFFLADGRTTVLEVVDELDAATRTDATEPSYSSRPWWQKAVSTVFRLHWDELPQPALRSVVQLPDDVRRSRDAPLRRRVQSIPDHLTLEKGAAVRRPFGSDRPELICAVHFITLPANGRCDECSAD